MALTDKLTAIANAIRGKTNTAATMTLDEMPTKIASIETVAPPYVKETYNGNNLVYAKMVGMKMVSKNKFRQAKYLSGIEFPEGLESIGSYAFAECYILRLSAIPPGVRVIGDYGFRACDSLNAITIPESMETLYSGAFSNCLTLETVTFEGTPKAIYSDVFANCTKLTTINVPWAEGEVADAPWGATQTTINYNYTGG